MLDSDRPNEIITRCAPAWAWAIIDHLFERIDEGDLTEENDLIIPGSMKPGDQVTDLNCAAAAIIIACKRADDQPLSRSEVEQSAI